MEHNIADNGYDKLQSCFKKTLQVFGKAVNYEDIDGAYSGEKAHLTALLTNLMKALKIIKLQMIFSRVLTKVEYRIEYFFHTTNEALLTTELIDEHLAKTYEEIVQTK